jgi:hypothetical protein
VLCRFTTPWGEIFGIGFLCLGSIVSLQDTAYQTNCTIPTRGRVHPNHTCRDAAGEHDGIHHLPRFERCGEIHFCLVVVRLDERVLMESPHIGEWLPRKRPKLCHLRKRGVALGDAKDAQLGHK